MSSTREIPKDAPAASLFLFQASETAARHPRMWDEPIRELEAMHEAEYQKVRLRLKQAGLHHMAHDTLRECFDALLTIPVELTQIDALAILAGTEHAGVHPDIVVEFLIRKALPSGYYFRAADGLLR